MKLAFYGRFSSADTAPTTNATPPLKINEESSDAGQMRMGMS
jgi:hypothetical protein